MSNINTTHQPARTSQLTPRQYRLLKALLSSSVMREQADRITGASNSPHIILTLRDMGLKISCERIPATDRDGKACKPGRYSLNPNSRHLANKLLGYQSGIISEGTG